MANVVPIFKKGDKSSVTNYRPISLTCLSMKIFEYCIRDLLMLKCKELLKCNQHGFRNGKSCLTQLLPFVDKLAEALNNQSRVDVIYFDFAKAFDCVNHDLILKKLKHKFGVDGLLLQFLKNYLQDRQQQVVIAGSISNVLPVYSGVPQGSILGPLLFILFIDDISDAVSEGTELALYADDTKIWREILCDNDQQILQNDIDSLYKWSIDNMMQFHSDKCKAVRITNKCIIYDLPFFEFWYSLNGTILDYETTEKDLGVYIHNKLSWSAHCASLASKGNNQLGLVRRTCYFINDSNQRRVLYLTLVRSIFEHCCQVWAPQDSNSINEFDLLQRRAVKWILKEPYVSYSDQQFLQKQRDLDLLPMKYKFIYSDIILFHKIVYDNVDIKLPKYVKKVEPQDIKCDTRSNISISKGNDKLKFKCTLLPKINAFKNSYFVRTLHSWNELPHTVREIDCVEKFSLALKDYLWLILGFEPD